MHDSYGVRAVHSRDHGQLVDVSKGIAAASPHCAVQVASAAQLKLHDEVQVNAHVEPDAHVAVPLSPIVTSQIAPFEHVYETLAPATTSHVAMSHDELELSPTVTSQLAPAWQATLHDIPHVPWHDEPAAQSTIWLPPLGIVQL